jgi:quinol monooxygenase YgiN
MRRFALTLAMLLGAALACAQTAQLYVVTYVDVYPNFAADAVKLLTQFRDASLKDEGAVRFEVLRDVGRPNHMAIVEVWSSRQAYEAHRMQPHSRDFREKLQPMLGSPFDERLYNSLP